MDSRLGLPRKRLEIGHQMIYSGLMMTTSISELKAHLSEKLRTVRGGTPILILDREHPVAELRPIEGPQNKPARYVARIPFRIPERPSLCIESDALSLLAAERGDR